VAKDRAAPFSRKHRRYWITITGGMILIGILNVAIGYCAYPGDKTVYRHTEPIIPILPNVKPDAAAAPDAAPAPAPDASPR
jgi:hypothetical protein